MARTPGQIQSTVRFVETPDAPERYRRIFAILRQAEKRSAELAEKERREQDDDQQPGA